MHIADLDRGMLGANGIVEAGMPLAVGARLTCAVKKTGGVGTTDGGLGRGWCGIAACSRIFSPGSFPWHFRRD